MYEELEKQLEKMRALESLLKVFNATEGEFMTAAALHAEYNLAQRAGLKTAPVIWASVVARYFNEAKTMEGSRSVLISWTTTIPLRWVCCITWRRMLQNHCRANSSW